MMCGLKKRYINFIEKDRRTYCERIAYGFLLIVSAAYAIVVKVRNALYDRQWIPSYTPKAQVISVGNISWAGSGKTPLSVWLYERLCRQWSVCIVRRGYGDDEKKLFEEKVGGALSGKDRVALIKKHEREYDVFILDDGFQYRRLRRATDIVIMGAREFRKPHRLIPAYFFREPLTALRRADIVIINHSDEVSDAAAIRQRIAAVNSRCAVYFSHYMLRRFVDLDGIEHQLDCFVDRPVAGFAAIGYPAGFFRKLRELGLHLRREIVYPDHYQLTSRQCAALEEELVKEGITTLVITHKDKFHFPYRPQKVNVFIMEVELVFDNEARLLDDLSKRINRNNNALPVN